MITLYAKREGTNVDLYNENGDLKARFPNTGYRPTKATKIVTVNCWKFKLQWEY